MRFSLFVTSPDDPFEPIYLDLREEISLLHAMEIAANDGYQFNFAVQYNSPNGPGYQIIMLNGMLANEQAQPSPYYWSIYINGEPFTGGLEKYIVQPKDVVVFAYTSGYALPLSAEKKGKASAKA